MQGQTRSLSKIVELMESGERPAAAQPPGLAVTMRPYQLQSLQFMLDAERRGSGPSLFLRTGSVLYSPVYGCFRRIRPSTPAGGMVAEGELERRQRGPTHPTPVLCLLGPAPPSRMPSTPFPSLPTCLLHPCPTALASAHLPCKAM